jgi:hypothetical protein
MKRPSNLFRSVRHLVLMAGAVVAKQAGIG